MTRSLRDNPFLNMAARQLRADVHAAPEGLRRRFTDEGRVARCRSVPELREAARRVLPGTVFDFVEGGAGDEVTTRRNRESFADVVLRPRVLRDVSDTSLATTVLGQRLDLPILGAPHGVGLLLHPHGEVGIARALHAAGTAYVVSSMASQSVEEIARGAPGPKWFQLYLWRDRGVTLELLERARAAGGFDALVITVDTPRVGQRERDLRNGFTIPPRITLRSAASGLTHPRWAARFVRSPEVGLGNFPARGGGGGAVNLTQYTAAAFDASAGWSDVAWLREHWPGPLVLKGILTAEDATEAARAGVDAVVVSNHGGRQLDHAPATISALPQVVEAAGEMEVLLDGGIRRGSDVAKALALGAKACLIGRPMLYGLAAGGQAGTARAIELLRAELELTMALMGCASVAELDRDAVELRRP